MTGDSLPIVYLGDEKSAAAFALAGVRAHAPSRGEEHAAFERARGEARVILLGTRLAAALPPNALANALAALAPIVAIVHDTDGRSAPETVARVRRQLGL